MIDNSKLASSLVSLSLCRTFLPEQKMSLLSPGEMELAFFINSMPLTFHAGQNDPCYLTWTALKPKTVLALIIKMLENQDVFHTTNGILQQLELSLALNYLIYFT